MPVLFRTWCALETFRALGIEFVSLSEQVDTSTPTGKMVFTVLGAVAEWQLRGSVDSGRDYTTTIGSNALRGAADEVLHK